MQETRKSSGFAYLYSTYCNRYLLFPIQTYFKWVRRKNTSFLIKYLLLVEVTDPRQSRENKVLLFLYLPSVQRWIYLYVFREQSGKLSVFPYSYSVLLIFWWRKKMFMICLYLFFIYGSKCLFLKNVALQIEFCELLHFYNSRILHITFAHFARHFQYWKWLYKSVTKF